MDQSVSSFFYRGRDPRRTFAFDRVFYSDEYGVQVTPIGISIGHGYRRNIIDIDKIIRVQTVVPGSEMKKAKWIVRICTYPFRCFPACLPQKSENTVEVYLYDGKFYSFRTDNPIELMHAITNARSTVY